ncbi:MAG: zinc-binding dehydrogenase [Gammaproteobacteria bacterium]|nr:zinc-binding dehydrogenase [Gammaproteobacteria bacterium]
MRAVVMRRGELVVSDVSDPIPGPGEVLVKTLACGICGSDLHALKHGSKFVDSLPERSSMRMDLTRDVVMGHEFCAEVLEHGPKTPKRMGVGSRVCAMPIIARQGAMLSVGYSNEVPGGYGERMVLAEQLLLPVANGLSTQRAALTEPMAVGFHAVEKAHIQEVDVPLVIGCGPVGLAVINALRLKDVHPIIAADFSTRRRELALTVGADEVIDPGETSPYARWTELAALTLAGERMPVNPLSGRPRLRPGVYFECVGVPGVIDQMMVGASSGCRFVVAGVCMEVDQIRPILAITKELNLQFVLGYSAEEFASTLNLIAEGDIVTEPLITGHIGLDEVGQAFRDLASPDHHAKILVEP